MGLLGVPACSRAEHGPVAADSALVEASALVGASVPPPLQDASSAPGIDQALEGGMSPASVVPPPLALGALYPPFKKTVVSGELLASLVAGAVDLRRLGGEPGFFEPGDNPYLRRSKVERADREGYSFTPQPVLWSPAEGMQVLVLTGRGKEGSFVGAWWPLPDGHFRLASTFVMLGEVAPVALVYRSAATRNERTLWWTTCWQCKGETGRVLLRDDRSVVIVQD